MMLMYAGVDAGFKYYDDYGDDADDKPTEAQLCTAPAKGSPHAQRDMHASFHSHCTRVCQGPIFLYN